MLDSLAADEDVKKPTKQPKKHLVIANGVGDKQSQSYAHAIKGRKGERMFGNQPSNQPSKHQISRYSWLKSSIDKVI